MKLEDFKKSDWYKERPQIIKDLICQFPNASTVRLKKTTQIAHVLSWNENGTITILITQQLNPNLHNALPGDYTVFGYNPDDLEFICENDDLCAYEDDNGCATLGFCHNKLL